jgi:hypothetical protein
VSLYPDHAARSCADHFRRSIARGTAVPPEELPAPAPRTVALEGTPDAVTTIVAAITDAVTGMVAAIRRAAAARGIS